MIPSQAEQIAEAQRIWEARIKQLRESTDKVDQIQGILMESLIGGQGMWEAEARIKAVAIYTLVQEWKR